MAVNQIQRRFAGLGEYDSGFAEFGAKTKKTDSLQINTVVRQNETLATGIMK